MILISLNSIPIGHCKEMCIFCAVRTKPLNIILLNFRLQKVKTAEASLPSNFQVGILHVKHSVFVFFSLYYA